MQLIGKYNKGVRYLLCAIDIFSKYAWVVPLRDKKGTTIVKAAATDIRYFAVSKFSMSLDHKKNLRLI